LSFNGLVVLGFVLLLGGFLQASQHLSNQLRSLVDRAQAAEQQNRLDEAVSLYEEILRLRPGWAAAELNLGLVQHSRGDYTKAIQILTKALQHNPSLHSALLFRGASYYSTGRFDDAVRDLEQYLRHDSKNAEALSYLANSQLARDDTAEAALAYAALARITSQPSAYFQLSECYLQLARNAMALLSGEEGRPYRVRIVEAERSADSEPCAVPQDPELTQARCGADRGEFDSATRTLIRIGQRAKKPPQTIYWSVGAYQRLAKAAIAKVIALAPDSSWAALLRAQAAEQSTQIEAAEKEYERAAKAPDAGFESYVRFGQFQAKQSRFDQALALYERAMMLEPENPRVMGLVGEVHVLQDRPENAVPLLERAVRANRRETQTRLYLAQALVRLGRGSEAIEILEAAPEDPDGRVHYQLGRIYQQQGEAEKARRAMDEFRKRRIAVKP
jgi:tetratricopeptide (TPR) repeat protein